MDLTESFETQSRFGLLLAANQISVVQSTFDTFEYLQSTLICLLSEEIYNKFDSTP